VIVRAGQRWLAFVTPAAPEGSVEHRFGTRFEGLWLDRAGRALRLLLPDRARRVGRAPWIWISATRTAPVPLIAAPPFPALSLGAMAAPAEPRRSRRRWSGPWPSKPLRPPAQDRLELVVVFDPVAPTPAPSPVARPEDLFGALVRAVRSLSAEPLRADRLDAAKLGRFAALASKVAEPLARWQAPVPDEAALPDGLALRHRVRRPDGPHRHPPRGEAGGASALAGSAGYAARPAARPWPGTSPKASCRMPARLQILVSGPRLPGAPRARVHASDPP
jgi:hypothetical protein